MITTVFRNLFTNAIKYTPIGGEIEIRSEEKNRGGRDFIELAVADTGVGMDENTRRQIFDLAGPKSMPGTNDEKGTGLGLVICKEFVEQNGGTIYAESSPGEGSTFYFTIPKISNI
jgi:signal transduction histidine kinase